MKIYGYHYFQNAAAKRDRLRERYAKEEETIAIKYNPLIAKAQKQVKRYAYYWLYSLAILIIDILILFDKLNLWYVKVFLALCIIGSLIVLGKTCYCRYKCDGIITEFNMASQSNQIVKDEIISLNQELARMALAIISYSEYHDELSIIKDEKELQTYFQEIYYQYHDAIDKMHNYNTTTEDFLNYYFQWQNDIL